MAVALLPSWNNDHVLLSGPCTNYSSFRNVLINHKAYIGMFSNRSDVKNFLVNHRTALLTVPRHTLTYVLWEYKTRVFETTNKHCFAFYVSYVILRNRYERSPLVDVMTCEVWYDTKSNDYNLVSPHPFHVFLYRTNFRPTFTYQFSTFNVLIKYLYDQEFGNEVTNLISSNWGWGVDVHVLYRPESMMMCGNKFKPFNRFSSPFARNCQTKNCEECKNSVLSLQKMCFFVAENYFGANYVKKRIPPKLSHLFDSEICKCILLSKEK
jgi:hypothetical protein